MGNNIIIISHEQNVKELYIRMPNFSFLGSIIKKKCLRVADPLKCFETRDSFFYIFIELIYSVACNLLISIPLLKFLSVKFVLFLRVLQLNNNNCTLAENF